MPPLTAAQVRNIVRNMIKVRGVTLTGAIDPIAHTPPDPAVPFSLPPVWQSGTYFDIAQPTRIRVPNNRGGRYFIHAELQWEPKMGTDFFSDAQSMGGFFGAYLVRNGAAGTGTREEAQSVAPVISGSALVTHNVILETHLAVGHYVELFVFQRVTGIDPVVEPFPIKVKATLTVRRLGRST